MRNSLWFARSFQNHLEAQVRQEHNTASAVARCQHECDVSAVLDNLDETPPRVTSALSPTQFRNQTILSPAPASYEPGSSQVTATPSDGGASSNRIEAGGAEASTPSPSRDRGAAALDSGPNPVTPASCSVPAAITGAGGACAAPKMASDAVSTQKDARDVVASEHPQPGPSPRNALTTNHYMNAGRRRVSPCQVGVGVGVGVGVEDHSRCCVAPSGANDAACTDIVLFPAVSCAPSDR